jgi:hypothetical protein
MARRDVDDDEFVARPRKKKRQATRGNGMLWALVACGGLLILLVVAAGIVWALWSAGAFAKSSSAKASGGSTDSSSSASLSAEAAKARSQLIGQWDHTSTKNPALGMSLDIRADGRVTLTAQKNGDLLTSEPGTWEAISGSADRVLVRLKFDSRSKPDDWEIELLPGETIRVNFKSGASESVVYKRRR